MHTSIVTTAVITLTIAGEGGRHLDRMLEQLEHYKMLANFDGHTVDISYSESVDQKKIF